LTNIIRLLPPGRKPLRIVQRFGR